MGIVAACGTDTELRAQPTPTTGAPTPDPAAAGTGTGTGAKTTGATATTTTPATAGAPATFVSHGPTDTRQVALTFHTNGDLVLAQQLLDLFATRKVHVTNFVVGNWLAQHPDWGKRLVDGGHEPANHTYTHTHFARLSPAQMSDEVTRCRDILAKTTGSGGRLFRPSNTANGIDSPSSAVLGVVGAAGYPTLLGYDVDPFDFKDPGSAAVSQRAIAALHPGAILSLHFGHPGTIAALPAILDAIDAKGLTAVTASALLG